MGDLAFFVGVFALVLGSQHAHDYGVEAGAVVGTALSERPFMDKPDVLEHFACVRVVLRDVYPCAVEIKLVEDVVQ